jgi:IS5 family transposase
VVGALFSQFDHFLNEQGFRAQKGQIIDASIVRVPVQRNNRDENAQSKAGQQPEGWSKNKQRQKDTEARCTKKNGKNFFGYKNHISVDVKHKLIRRFHVTSVEVHDSKVFDELLDSGNTSRYVWADSAYRSQDRISEQHEYGYREYLQRKGSRNHKYLQRKGSRNHKLMKWELQGNGARSKIRSGIEHIFGVQTQRAGNMIMCGIGLIRVVTKIGLRNLAYNLDRYGTIVLVHG